MKIALLVGVAALAPAADARGNTFEQAASKAP